MAIQASDFAEWATTPHEQDILMDAYKAMESTGTRDWLSTFETASFMFLNPTPPELAQLQKAFKCDGHSGASYGWTMRYLQKIARAGWRPVTPAH